MTTHTKRKRIKRNNKIVFQTENLQNTTTFLKLNKESSLILCQIKNSPGPFTAAGATISIF